MTKINKYRILNKGLPRKRNHEVVAEVMLDYAAKVLGSNHAFTSRIYKKLADICEDSGDMRKALEYHRCASTCDKVNAFYTIESSLDENFTQMGLSMRRFVSMVRDVFGKESFEYAISLNEEGTMTIYHNSGLVGEADGVENKFPETGSLSFGCPVPEEQNIFVEHFSSWQGGIDSLFLFDQSFSEHQINSFYEAELNMYLWENLDQYIIDSYWSLGEDAGDTVRDAIGTNNGKANPMVIFREH